jgi:integrase
MKRRLTETFVKNAPIPATDRTYYWDASLAGFALSVTEQGAKSWVCQFRWAGKTRRLTMKGIVPLDDARLWAREKLIMVAKGIDPEPKSQAAPEPTFREIADSYLRIEGKALRSHDKYARTLERLVYPAIGDRPIRQIERYEITTLLDAITKDNGRGVGMAKLTLAIVRRVMSWHATRDSRFVSPMVAGMGPRKAAGASGSRVLTDDDEVRRVWAASAVPEPFHAIVRLLLLTAARREEIGAMRWDEIKGDLWTLPPERHKTGRTAGELARPLSKAAMAIVNAQPRIQGSPYIFGQRGFGNWTSAKERFDRESGVTDWSLHGLRKTARTLLSRAKVDADLAERMLGHARPSIEKTYNHHKFIEEQRAAFEALSSLIERIANPPASNVIALGARQ